MCMCVYARVFIDGEREGKGEGEGGREGEKMREKYTRKGHCFSNL